MQKNIRIILINLLIFTLLFADEFSKPFIQQGYGNIDDLNIKISPDSKIVLTAPKYSGGELKLWDLATGKLLSTLRGHTKSIVDITFSPDGKYILSGQEDGKLIFWEVKSGKEIRTFTGDTNCDISAFALSPNGESFLTGGKNGSLILWDTKTGEKIKTFLGHPSYTTNEYGMTFSTGGITSIAFNPNGMKALSSSRNDTYYWDLSVETPIYTIKEGSSETVFTADGNQAILHKDFGGVISLDVATGKPKRVLENRPTKDIVCLKSSKVGILALLRNENGTLEIWNLKTKKVIEVKIPKREYIKEIDISSNADKIAVVNGIRYVSATDTEAESHLSDRGPISYSYLMSVPESDSVFEIYDLKSGQNKKVVTYEEPIGDGRFSLNGNIIIFNNKRLDLDTGEFSEIVLPDFTKLYSTNFEYHPVSIYTDLWSYAIAPDEKNVVTWFEMTDSFDVDVWDIVSGKINYIIEDLPSVVKNVSFSTDGKTLLLKHVTPVISLFDMKNGKSIGTIDLKSDNNKSTTPLSLSPDGRIKITGGVANGVKIWNAKNGEELLHVVSFKDGEWILLTPEGYFNGSQGVIKHLNITRHTPHGMEPFDFSQLYDHFFRPDLVKLKLSGDETVFQKITRGLTYQDALKNPPPKLAFISLDEKNVQTSGFEYEPVDTVKEKVNLTVNVKEHDGGGVGLIRVYQEGKLIQTIGEGEIKKESANVDAILAQEKLDSTLKENQKTYFASLAKSISGDVNLSVEEIIANVESGKTINQPGTYKLELELKSGKNEIGIEAFNKTNTVTSYRETIIINANIPKLKPKLYAIVAGVNEFEAPSVNNLKYSQNDAHAIKEAVQMRMNTVFEDVEVNYLTGKEVTKENILKSVQEISKKAKLDDTVLFYISTHGRSARGKLYLVPYNNKNVKNWIDFEQTFQAVQSIKALNQIFVIDACESGKANDIVSSVYDSRASVLAKSSGVHMLLATTKGTSAFEHPDPTIKNGVFTHRILEAMNNKETDANKDSLISIKELSKKLKEPNSNADYQYPVIRNVGKDIILEKTM